MKMFIMDADKAREMQGQLEAKNEQIRGVNIGLNNHNDQL